MTQTSDGKQLIAICDKNKDIIAGEDGLFVFWPTRIGVGALTPEYLRIIADELDRRNAPWQKELDEYFSQTEADPNSNEWDI